MKKGQLKNICLFVCRLTSAICLLAVPNYLWAVGLEGMNFNIQKP